MEPREKSHTGVTPKGVPPHRSSVSPPGDGVRLPAAARVSPDDGATRIRRKEFVQQCMIEKALSPSGAGDLRAMPRSMEILMCTVIGGWASDRVFRSRHGDQPLNESDLKAASLLGRVGLAIGRSPEIEFLNGKSAELFLRDVLSSALETAAGRIGAPLELICPVCPDYAFDEGSKYYIPNQPLGTSVGYSAQSALRSLESLVRSLQDSEVPHTVCLAYADIESADADYLAVTNETPRSFLEKVESSMEAARHQAEEAFGNHVNSGKSGLAACTTELRVCRMTELFPDLPEAMMSIRTGDFDSSVIREIVFSRSLHYDSFFGGGPLVGPRHEMRNRRALQDARCHRAFGMCAGQARAAGRLASIVSQTPQRLSREFQGSAKNLTPVLCALA